MKQVVKTYIAWPEKPNRMRPHLLNPVSRCPTIFFSGFRTVSVINITHHVYITSFKLSVVDSLGWQAGNNSKTEILVEYFHTFITKSFNKEISYIVFSLLFHEVVRLFLKLSVVLL